MLKTSAVSTDYARSLRLIGQGGPRKEWHLENRESHGSRRDRGKDPFPSCL